MAVTKLIKDQFAINLGEPIDIKETGVAVVNKTGGVYSLSIEIKFACKQEYVEGGNNDLDPKLGSLAVFLTGVKPPAQIVTPDSKMYADKNDATYISLLLKIPDGVKGNHD